MTRDISYVLTRAISLGWLGVLCLILSPLLGACGGVTSGEESDGGDERCSPACDDNASCQTDANGSRCVCDNGFGGDGETCVDLNECSDMSDDCDVNATCTNTEGSFTCECNSGFSGDGRTCTSLGVWRYDFEQLTAGTVASQDGWYAGFTSEVPSVIVNGATAVNRTKLVTVEGNSAGSIARKNDVTFSFGPFTGTETNAYIQVDFRWNRADDANGATFAIGNDLDANGNLGFGESVAIRIQDGRYGFDNENIGPSQLRSTLGAGTVADWYRLRLVMNFASGTATLFYSNLTRGDSTLSVVVSGSLDLNTLVPGAEVTAWNTITLFSNKLTEWDNIEIGLSE